MKSNGGERIPEKQKRLLSPAPFPDVFTRSLYKVAPYQGCAHGCRYCDGRAERYYVAGDFEKDIVRRRDIPTRLASDLGRLRESGMVAFGSGTTDPYQPCEAEDEITGSCARILANYGTQGWEAGSGDLFSPGREAGLSLPCLVMTKSALALRDLEAWKRVNKASGFVLLVSLTSLDEELRSWMEPGASSFAERLALLKAYKEAGCATGILAMPFLPGLSDATESIAAVYAAAKEARVDFVMPGGLTLRPGRQKELYLATLAANRPELLQTTAAVFREERASGWAGAEETKALSRRIEKIREEAGLPWLLPHAVYASFLPAHDAFRLLLRDMIELYTARGIATAPLRRSADAYDAWLLEQRHFFRHNHRLPPAWLDALLPEASRSGELRKILDNDKLAAFSDSVIQEGARLNYLSLKLECST
jgi:DNA repair photolyase